MPHYSLMTNAQDSMDPQYLKTRYGGQYRASKGEDGIWNLITRFKPRDVLEYDVYVHGKGRLAALLPGLAADRLMRDFPDDFTLHQNADDGKVVLFQEEDLERFAGRLKLRKRRRMSEEQKLKAVERVRRFRFKAQVTVSPVS